MDILLDCVPIIDTYNYVVSHNKRVAHSNVQHYCR